MIRFYKTYICLADVFLHLFSFCSTFHNNSFVLLFSLNIFTDIPSAARAVTQCQWGSKPFVVIIWIGIERMLLLQTLPQFTVTEIPTSEVNNIPGAFILWSIMNVHTHQNKDEETQRLHGSVRPVITCMELGNVLLSIMVYNSWQNACKTLPS